MTWAGVELGGTKCIAVLASGPGDVLARETVATTSPEQTLGSIAKTLSKWQSQNGFRALGVAALDPSTSIRFHRGTGIS